MDGEVATGQLLGLAFAVSFAFGAIARKTRFCTMGAVADLVATGDGHRMRMWLLAIGVAVLGAAGLHAAGLADLGQSIYRTPKLLWLSHLVGGLCFGAGMVLASGCGAQTLVRLGGGSLKALLVAVVLGLSATMTLRGVLGVVRVDVLDQAALALPGGTDLPALLRAAGLAPGPAFWLPVLAVGGGLIACCLARRDFRSADHLLGGVGTGLAVVAAWYVSGHLGYVAEHPETLQPAFLATNSGRLESLSFVGPQAYGLDLLMLWSDRSRHPTLGIASLLGVVAGSAAWSVATGSFRWEGFAGLEDTARHLLGAALMGFGGITALGCSIGQGVSGVSTLALGAILTLLAIVAGAAATLKLQYRRLLRQA